MLDTHPSDRLAAYLDGELPDIERNRVEAHLGTCARCRHALELVRSGRTALQHLPIASAPDAIWSAIETSADFRTRRPPAVSLVWRLAAAVLVLGIAASVYRIWSTRNVTSWQVMALQGSPVAGSRRLSGGESVPSGKWLETDASSRARIVVGSIGSVTLEPNSRVRLLSTDASGHRLALGAGGIQASISAPPRLFFVETPAGTAIDLGCEYQLHCDRNGTGMLRVTSGWVALEWKGRESLVPAGASCRMYAGRGPGIPWFEDAGDGFLRALGDFETHRGESLDRILAEARTRDTLTLWHLLSRVEAGDRVRVFDRMATLAPLPPGLLRDRVLELDTQSLKKWREELAWTW